MKSFIVANVAAAAFVLIGFAAPAMAQTAEKPAAKAAAKPGTTAAAKKAAAPKKRSARLAPAAQKAVEEVTPVDDDPSITLSEADLEIARKVYMGDIPCELGAMVKIGPARRDGFFLVTTKGQRFLMHPVASRTGAVRLEDPRRGALWIQLGNKSMLMSQKLGQRLADECQSPTQLTLAEELRKNPQPGLLDAAPSGPPANR